MKNKIFYHIKNKHKKNDNKVYFCAFEIYKCTFY